jgi:hypothetical protein
VKLKKTQLRKLSSQPFGEWEMRMTPPEKMVEYDRYRDHFRPDTYLNNRYSVQISDEATDWGLVVHLWLRRHDGEMVRSWADMQRIKNELVGPERVAVEVFPPVSQLIDNANIAHLWVMPDGFSLPFSLKRGVVP